MADNSNQINQDEIEALLRQVRGSDPTPPPDKPAPVGQDEIEAMLSGVGAGGGSASGVGTEVSQSEIESLLSNAVSRSAKAAKQTPPPKAPTAAAPPAPKPAAAQSKPAAASAATSAPAAYSPPPRKAGKVDDLDYLLRQTQEALASIDAPVDPAISNLASFSFEELKGSTPTDDYATLDLLRDVELELKIELGRTEMFLEDVLRLKRGSVVALDKLAGDPVDIYVNGRLVARGEVLVLNDNFCVRVAELVAGNDLD